MDNHHYNLVDHFHQEANKKYGKSRVVSLFLRLFVLLGMFFYPFTVENTAISVCIVFGMYYLFYAQIISTIVFLIYYSVSSKILHNQLTELLDQGQEEDFKKQLFTFYGSKTIFDFFNFIFYLLFPVALFMAEHYWKCFISLAFSFIFFSLKESLRLKIEAFIEAMSENETKRFVKG